jgi:hypothetical protein
MEPRLYGSISVCNTNYWISGGFYHYINGGFFAHGKGIIHKPGRRNALVTPTHVSTSLFRPVNIKIGNYTDF